MRHGIRLGMSFVTGKRAPGVSVLPGACTQESAHETPDTAETPGWTGTGTGIEIEIEIEIEIRPR